jgi:hypothetical protein
MEKFKRKFHTLPNSKKIKIKIETVPFLFVPYNFCGIFGVPGRIGRRKTDISFLHANTLVGPQRPLYRIDR